MSKVGACAPKLATARQAGRLYLGAAMLSSQPFTLGVNFSVDWMIDRGIGKHIIDVIGVNVTRCLAFAPAVSLIDFVCDDLIGGIHWSIFPISGVTVQPSLSFWATKKRCLNVSAVTLGLCMARSWM